MPKRTDPGTLTEVKQAAVADLSGKNVPEDSATRRENAAKDAAPPAQTASVTRMVPPVSERVVHSSMLGAQLNCSVPPETVSVDPSANSA